MRTLSRLVLLLSFILFSGCSSLFYYPDRMLYAEPKTLGLKAEEVHFVSTDGTKLMGWFFPAQLEKNQKVSKGIVIQFHGNATNMSNHFLSLVWLVKEGYDFFTFDYRGYGRSEGKPEPEGTARDGVAALRQALVLQKKSQSPRLIVIGQSLGGAIVMRSLQDLGTEITPSLVVLESTFVSYQKIGQRILARHWYGWPFQWMSYLVLSDHYTGQEWLGNYKGALVILHDELDPVVPFACGEDLRNLSVRASQEFWTRKEGEHIAAFLDSNTSDRPKLLKKLAALPPQ